MKTFPSLIIFFLLAFSLFRSISLPAQAFYNVEAIDVNNSDGEEYYEPIKWTTIRTGGDQHYVLPVDKNVVKAGGKTILELKYSSLNGDNFAQNIQVSVLTPWMHYYQVVPGVRIVSPEAVNN
jgi:hypothetical protein